MSWIKFIQGDSSAFELIYSEYVDDLFSYGVQFYSDKETVLDCIHDLFLSIYRNPKIAPNVQVKYYLFASLRRRLLRYKTSQEKLNFEQLNESISWTDDYELEMIHENIREEQLQLLKEKVDKLPSRQREVLFLRYYMDLSYEQIAQMMAINIDTCRTLSFRAIKQLRLELKTLEFPLLLIFALVNLFQNK